MTPALRQTGPDRRHPGRSACHPERWRRISWRFGGLEIEYRPAPLLAADNGYVFGEILGLPPEEVRRLEEARVTY